MSKPPETRLLLVRHGESVVTVNRVIGGPKTCSGLSELGHRQAAALRDRFAAGLEPAIDRLWVSAMPRAQETAATINEALGLEVNVDVDLEERRPGDADGLRFDEYPDKFGAPEALRNDPYRPIAPNGESRIDFHYRAGTAIERVIAANIGRTTMVVCHGGVIDVAFRSLLGLAVTAPFELWSLNTSITDFILVSEQMPRRWRLGRYNDTAHLAGLPAETPRD